MTSSGTVFSVPYWKGVTWPGHNSRHLSNVKDLFILAFQLVLSVIFHIQIKNSTICALSDADILHVTVLTCRNHNNVNSNPSENIQRCSSTQVRFTPLCFDFLAFSARKMWTKSTNAFSCDSVWLLCSHKRNFDVVYQSERNLNSSPE